MKQRRKYRCYPAVHVCARFMAITLQLKQFPDPQVMTERRRRPSDLYLMEVLEGVHL